MQSQWSNSAHAADDFERLKLRVRRSSAVPVPKESALRLLEVLRNPDAPTPEIERIVGSDPALAASIIGASESTQSLSYSKHITLRDAIVRLGTRALKGIALGTSFRMDTGAPVVGFDRPRFARHCVAVAFVSKYLFAKRFLSGTFETNFTADEVYAIALIHDIGYVLLATVAPEIYGRIAFMARRSQATIPEGFSRLYQGDLTELAPEFLNRWPHLHELEKAVLAIKAPWTFEEEYDALCCISAADWIVSTRCNLAIEDWPLALLCLPEVEPLCCLPEDEFQLLDDAVRAHVARSFLQ